MALINLARVLMERLPEKKTNFQALSIIDGVCFFGTKGLRPEAREEPGMLDSNARDGVRDYNRLVATAVAAIVDKMYITLDSNSMEQLYFV